MSSKPTAHHLAVVDSAISGSVMVRASGPRRRFPGWLMSRYIEHEAHKYGFSYVDLVAKSFDEGLTTVANALLINSRRSRRS